jgi:hypothetical protein
MESLVLLETVRSAHFIKDDPIAVWIVNVQVDLKHLEYFWWRRTYL